MLLKFISRKFKPGGEDETYTCSTEILDTGIIGYYKDDWKRDAQPETWGHEHWNDRFNGIQDHNFLGACAKDFRPYDQLEFQVMLPSGKESARLFDDLEICYLRVTFGNTRRNRTGSSVWKWGNRYNVSPFNTHRPMKGEWK